eukprot:1628455-Amphidinium_carterae.1
MAPDSFSLRAHDSSVGAEEMMWHAGTPCGADRSMKAHSLLGQFPPTSWPKAFHLQSRLAFFQLVLTAFQLQTS